MKRVLSFLLMIVFTQASIAPAFAKSGGPSLGGATVLQTFGTYAGVLIPTTEDEDGANSIGLFSLGVPETGLANGAFVLFIEGLSYTGSMIGVADPLNGRLRGILEADSSPFIDPATGLTFVLRARGSIDAEIRETATFSSLSSGSQNLSQATTRIEGIAQVEAVDFSGRTNEETLVTFIVDGFKQSGTAADTTTISFGGNAP